MKNYSPGSAATAIEEQTPSIEEFTATATQLSQSAIELVIPTSRGWIKKGVICNGNGSVERGNNVGVIEIDEQHKKLFEIVNRIKALLNDELIFDKYDGIIAIINELKEYTIYHFKTVKILPMELYMGSKLYRNKKYGKLCRNSVL